MTEQHHSDNAELPAWVERTWGDADEPPLPGDEVQTGRVGARGCIGIAAETGGAEL